MSFVSKRDQSIILSHSDIQNPNTVAYNGDFAYKS